MHIKGPHNIHWQFFSFCTSYTHGLRARVQSGRSESLLSLYDAAKQFTKNQLIKAKIYLRKDEKKKQQRNETSVVHLYYLKN